MHKELAVCGWESWQDRPLACAQSLEALRVACQADEVVFLPKIGIDDGIWTADHPNRLHQVWYPVGQGPLAPFDANPRIRVEPYVYIDYSSPTQQDYDRIVQLLTVRRADQLVLNLEESWFGATNAELQSYGIGLASALARAGLPTRLGGSTVASWTGKYGNFFPYEGLAAVCLATGGTMYDQWYWTEGQTDPDVIAAAASRLPAGVPLVPILVGLPQSDMGQWPVSAVKHLAQRGLTALGDRISGWASWVWRPDWSPDGQIAAYGLFGPQGDPQPQTAPPTRLPLPQNDSDNPAAWHDALTDTWVTEPTFLQHYLDRGPDGLAEYGHPIAGMTWDHQTGIYAQYFERARFELHPDGQFYLGLVGREAAQAAGVVVAR